jgi:hypothetical protein
VSDVGEPRGELALHYDYLVNQHHLVRYAEAMPRLIAYHFAHMFAVSVVLLAIAWMERTELGAEPVDMRRLLSRQRHMRTIDLGLVEPRATIAPARRLRLIMRVRSLTTLCSFGAPVVVSLGYPIVGLGMCCCCLIGYLRPGIQLL